MYIIHIYIIYSLLCYNIIFAEDYDKEEELHAKLELIDMDLEEMCEDMAISLRRSLLENPVNFTEKSTIENKYGNYLKSQRHEITASEENYQIRNLTLLIKSGDWLLPQDSLLKLITYHNTFEETSYNYEIIDEDANENITKQELVDILATSRNETSLQNKWSKWQHSLLYGDPFNPILQLTSKAAELNGVYNVKEYWELLVDYKNAYERAQELWREIEPLYLKVHKFALNRINRHYETNYTYIPAYLTGTNFGEDWSNIADILLPHPQLLHDVNFHLKGKSNRDAFIQAEKMLKEMGLGGLKKQFWSHSNFNLNSCENKINPYCSSRYSEVLTCNKLDWYKYLNAHESAMQVVLNNKDYDALMRINLRQSAFDEALISLSSIFAIDYLPANGVLPENAFSDEGESKNKETALLLAALRILPKIPYYLAADMWRLDEIEENFENLTSTWWEYRIKYQGVQGFTNEEPDFLSDSHFVSNKPYISKFYGLLLQFKLLDYYQVGLFNEGIQAITSFHDQAFFSAIRDRPTKTVDDLMQYHYGINEISADSLLTYFEPLEEYLETFAEHRAPVKQRKTEPLATAKPKIVKTVEISPITSSVLQVKNDSLTVLQETTTITPKEPRIEPNNEATKQSTSYIILTVLVCIIAASVIVYFIYKHIKTRRRNFQRNRRENTDV